ncbi:MAG: ArsR/SmtB family transcription factor [Nitrosopumilus sp.]
MNGLYLLRCICDETRFEILEMLQKKDELCVNDFVKKLEKDQPLISHHLKTLKNCGVVKSRCQGKKSMYSISNNKLSALITDITKTSREMSGLCSEESCC